MQTLTRQTLKIFWQHSKRYTWQPYALFLVMVVVSLLRDFPPILYSKVINLLASGVSANVAGASLKLLIVILTLNFVRISLWRLANLVNNNFQSGVMADLTRTCYEYLQNHSIGFFNSSFVGSLVTKVKRYERAFEQLSDQFLYNIGRAFLELFIIVGILFWRYWPLGTVVLAWAIIYIVYTYFYAQFKLPYDLKRADADTRTTARLADTITNNFNIKVFASYLMEFAGFRKVVDEQHQARKKSWDLGTFGEIFQSLAMIGLEFGLMYYVIVLWQRGILTVGDIALVQAYLMRLFDQLWDTGKNIRAIYEALADAKEMTEILSIPHKVRDAPGAGKLKVSKGEIEFQNLNFGYHREAEILQDFTLKIASGERVALVGPSGGGKSTIVKLLLRFYDLRSGLLLIDGQNIVQVTQDSLRQQIALVPQDPILFHRSLLDNIRYGLPRASEVEVVEAAKAAHAHEFIENFAQGYQTFVGERGVKLSGGERQRVAIARAILKNAPILVLDEATSSLDSESERLIQDALKTLMKNKTTIVIAHRLSTIMEMDRIIVVENGRITEQGKHAELLKAKTGTYQRLWQIQAGGFEMAG